MLQYCNEHIFKILILIFVDKYQEVELLDSMGFLCGSAGKESACNAGDLGLIPGLVRSLGGGHGNPLQYFCLENPHGQRSLAGYRPRGCKESDMTEQLSRVYISQHCKAIIVQLKHFLKRTVSWYGIALFFLLQKEGSQIHTLSFV